MKPDIRITKKLIANRDYGGKNYNVLPVYLESEGEEG